MIYNSDRRSKTDPLYFGPGTVMHVNHNLSFSIRTNVSSVPRVICYISRKKASKYILQARFVMDLNVICQQGHQPTIEHWGGVERGQQKLHSAMIRVDVDQTAETKGVF